MTTTTNPSTRVNGTLVFARNWGSCYTFSTAHRDATATVSRSGRIMLSTRSTWLPGDDATFQVPRHDRDADQALGWLALALGIDANGSDFRRHGFAPDFARWVARRRRDEAEAEALRD
jgi:hypothetical protein